MRSACRYFAGFIVLAIVSAARAEEGGAGHYAPGSFASFVDVLPSKPSLGAFNYFTYYNGSSGVSRQFPVAGQIDLNVDATSYADSLGAFGVTPLKILGAYYAPASRSRSCGRTSRRRSRCPAAARRVGASRSADSATWSSGQWR